MSCCLDGYGDPCLDCEECLGESYWNDTQPFLPGLEPPPPPPPTPAQLRMRASSTELNEVIARQIMPGVVERVFSSNDEFHAVRRKR